MKLRTTLFICLLTVCVIMSSVVLPSSAALTLTSGKTSSGTTSKTTVTNSNTTPISTTTGSYTLISDKKSSESSSVKEKDIYEDMLETMAFYEQELINSERNTKVDLLSVSVMGSRSSVGSKVVLAQKKTIKEIKTIYSLNGDTFTLIECSPIGYMIYHNETGTFTEYSFRCNSPFSSFDGTYIYNGLGDYYVKTSTKYINPTDEEIVTAADITASKEYAKSSVETYKQAPNKYALDYVSGKTSLKPSEQKALENTLASSVSTKSMSTLDTSGVKSLFTTSKFVPNCSYFDETNLINNGYSSGGKCGFIAAGMLMYYNTRMGIKNMLNTPLDFGYVPDNGTDGEGWVIASHVVNKQLRIAKELGYCQTDNGTNASILRQVIAQYITKHSPKGCTVTHDVVLYPNATGANIYNRICNGHPVIAFGSQNYYNGHTNAHAVLIYGAIKEGLILPSYSYCAHFTWESGCSCVFFSTPQKEFYTFY